jgi:hypothetical protein
MERKARTILLNGAGWGAKKHPAVGEVFFLDFPLYRTYRELAHFRAMNTRGGARFADQVLGFKERKFADQVLWLYGAAHIHCLVSEQKACMAAA